MSYAARVLTVIAVCSVFGCRTTTNKDAAAKAASAGPSMPTGIYSCSGEAKDPQAEGALNGTYHLYAAAERGLLSWIHPDKSETLRDAECKLDSGQMVTSCHTVAESDPGPADKVTWTYEIDHKSKHTATLRGGAGGERVLAAAIGCVAEADKSLSENRP